MVWINEGMFDHLDTVADVQRAWMGLRANIPQWHEGGATRSELARVCALRVDVLRRV